MANPTFKSIINRSTGGSKALLYLRGWAWRLDRSVHDSVTVGESCDKSLVLLLPTTSRFPSAFGLIARDDMRGPMRDGVLPPDVEGLGQVRKASYLAKLEVWSGNGGTKEVRRTQSQQDKRYLQGSGMSVASPSLVIVKPEHHPQPKDHSPSVLRSRFTSSVSDPKFSWSRVPYLENHLTHFMWGLGRALTTDEKLEVDRMEEEVVTYGYNQPRPVARSPNLARGSGDFLCKGDEAQLVGHKIRGCGCFYHLSAFSNINFQNEMPSFSCDGCGDVVKKPKLDSHSMRCRASVTCLDCSTTFNGPAHWKAHTSCISEAQKYQKSLYQAPKNKKSNNDNQQVTSKKNLPTLSAPVIPVALPSVEHPTVEPLTAPSQTIAITPDQVGTKEVKEKRSKKDKKRKLQAIDQPVQPDPPIVTQEETGTTVTKGKKQKIEADGKQLENSQGEQEAVLKLKNNNEEESRTSTKKEKRKKKQKKTTQQDEESQTTATPADNSFVHKGLPHPLNHSDVIKTVQAMITSSQGKSITFNDLVDGVLKTVISNHRQQQKQSEENNPQHSEEDEKAWRSIVHELFCNHLQFAERTIVDSSSSVGLAWNGSPL
ncbi:hypothetical protein PSTG_09285 [Puccinia striiformis f. sp. tritici PST-78]|uniref:Zinc finger C2H2 LYAR-type domain-containing protein n=3 Tax=Puccinia striiformis f. sp. tritici TaxID=168172 RepID=A0A0L0VE29_9BASI|nr:hypothetical protein PSTG_09285 [Puccinia striiformis f. sp. tritici PST-78]